MPGTNNKNEQQDIGGLLNEVEAAYTMDEKKLEYLVLMRLVRMLDARIDEISRTVHGQIKSEVREAMEDHVMTMEERDYLRVMIEKQRQSIAFRRAVIEKTTTALVWSGIVALAVGGGTLLKEYAQAHGMWNP